MRRFGEKKARKEVPVNPAFLFAQREIWSSQFPLWKRYEVRRARLPSERDEKLRWVDRPDNQPRAFSGFVGAHNKEFFAQLENIADTFSGSSLFPEILTIAGPSGSGKSVAAKLFLQRLVDEQNFGAAMANKWCLALNARDYPINDLAPLWARIAKFAEAPLERAFRGPFRCLLIDNFDHIPPSSQQQFKRLLLTFGGALKCVLVCADPRNSMIGSLVSKSTIARTRAVADRDALAVVLSIFCRENIGYDRDGVKAIFAHHSSTSLSHIIDTAQKVFVEREFISYDNVQRVLGKPVEIPIVSPTAAIEPIERCKLCTLKPPCKHITEHMMLKKSVERRKELPRYQDGSMPCPEFVRLGHCSMFNKHGHCSLDHPKNIHRVDVPLRRCPQCTIPWPCNHCAYNTPRNQLRHMIQEIQGRLVRLKQINVPDPPLAFTKHLDTLNRGWREEVARINRTFNIPENINALQAVSGWLETSFSINTLAYQNRCKLLASSFGDLYTSELLLLKPRSPETHSAPRATVTTTTTTGSIPTTGVNAVNGTS